MGGNAHRHDHNPHLRQATGITIMNKTDSPSPRLPGSSTMATTSSSTTTTGYPDDGPVCDRIDIDYKVAPAVICGVCLVFGILYCFFGYRFFKATMFMTGFIFGSVVTYLICLEENLLPLEGKIGVSITAGVLCGLITMLVQYVGLFMTGFHFGLLLGVSALIIMEFFYHPYTKWICIGILFGTGLVCALLILYFQKSFTILGTSIFGSALILVAFDYYIEMFMMVNYVWDRIKAEYSDSVCWFSWFILAMWPATFIVGAVTQGKVTSKGFDHHEAIVRRPRRRGKANLQRARERHRREASRATRETLTSREPQPSRGTPRHDRQGQPVDPVHSRYSRYRHLYQIRRVNGDVVAQVHHCVYQISPP